ncbi:MAG: hypothetical protein VX589_15725 [Myxococcota bacterium]|nr:hypothetical protein [Myxococcota bacterium]
MTDHARIVPATLEGLRTRPADPLILAIRADGQPLTGLTALIDWRMGGQISQLVLAGTFNHDSPVLRPSPSFIPCGRLLLWRLGAVTPRDLAHVVRDLNVDTPGICPEDFDFSDDEVERSLGHRVIVYRGPETSS